MAGFKPQNDLHAIFPTRRKLVFQQNRPTSVMQAAEMRAPKRTLAASGMSCKRINQRVKGTALKRPLPAQGRITPAAVKVASMPLEVLTHPQGWELAVSDGPPTLSDNLRLPLPGEFKFSAADAALDTLPNIARRAIS
jgi:hypothetical protein